MKAKKRLFVVSLTPEVGAQRQHILEKIIGDRVLVSGTTADRMQLPDSAPTAILLSAPFLTDRVAPLFPGVPIVCSQHIITGHNIEKLLVLPKGTKAMVVASHVDIEREIVDNLLSCGIEQIEYSLFRESNEPDYARVNLAITPGMAYFVPRQIPDIIDIGLRSMTIYSFLRLLEALKLDPYYIEKYAYTYTNLLLESRWKLADLQHYAETRKKREEALHNELDSGVICFDRAGRVESINLAALGMLRRAPSEVVGLPLEQVLSPLEARDTISLENGKSTSIYILNGQQVMATRLASRDDAAGGSMIVIKKIDSPPLEESSARRETRARGFMATHRFDDIITCNRGMRELIETARRFAKTDRNVLIMGESGTGKELFAHAIHLESPQKNGPFISVNFAGISSSLMESELFGYAEGSFTGAMKGGRKGLFEQASGGSIFLDEIGDSPLDLQARLLRVLQEKQVMAVGSDRIKTINTRIIAATNVDLEQAVLGGLFRQDLFYRLSTLVLKIPPLRERAEDIPLIINTYLRHTYGIGKTFTPRAEERLAAYPWPGNIRELINLAEYLCYFAQGSYLIDLHHLPPQFTMNRAAPAPQTQTAGGSEALDRLLEQGLPLKHIRALLDAFDAGGMGRMGRYALRGICRDMGCDISESQLRKLLERLNEQGMVKSGSTRQGSTLTLQGQALRAYLARQGAM